MTLTLVEKYRPDNLDKIEGNDWIKKVLRRMIANGTTQHMIFAGPPGTGKTTTAYAFATEYLDKKINLRTNESGYEELNASDTRGIDVVRGHIKNWAYAESQERDEDGNKLKKVLVLEEADHLTPDAQAALRVVMEKCQDNCIIILVLNHIEGIKERAILSRCSYFPFDPQPTEVMARYFKGIADKEDIKFSEDEILKDIVSHPEYRGDFRRVVNDTLQKLVGINHKVTKEDLPWIYRDSYKSLIDKMISEKNFVYPYFSYDKNINETTFIRQLCESIEMKNFELAKIFAEVEYRIKNGGDPLVQMSALLTACEVYL